MIRLTIAAGSPVDVLAQVATVPEAGCWLWLGDTSARRGYGRLRVAGRSVRAHRFSWEVFKGPIPTNMCVCHKCDTPACVNPDHLFLGTNEENTADRVRKGRSRGATCGARNPVKHEQHHQAKLTPEQVQEIRDLARTGQVPQREIAAKFGVSQANVSTIKNGVTWYEGRRSRAARCGGAS